MGARALPGTQKLLLYNMSPTCGGTSEVPSKSWPLKLEEREIWVQDWGDQPTMVEMAL